MTRGGERVIVPHVLVPIEPIRESLDDDVPVVEDCSAQGRTVHMSRMGGPFVRLPSRLAEAL